MTDTASPIEYIHSFGHKRYKKRELSDTRRLIDLLGSPDRDLKFIHVAGTNGKGSVSAMLDSILRCAGYRTGLFTSPYVTRFNERIRVNGEDIEASELEALTEEVRPVVGALEEKPTEFELLTVIGLMYFKKKNCDIVVLETGMGGRFDFTNVISCPEAAIITSIGPEHLNYLGPTLADVAFNKAGIIKKGCELVFAGAKDEARREIINEAKTAGVPFTEIYPEDIKDPVFTPDGTRFFYKDYGEISVPLAGVFQPLNAALAIEACEALKRKGWNIKNKDVIDGIRKVVWKGRMEKLSDEPLFFLDGAHNPPAAEAVAESLKAILGDRKVIFIIGVMADKDIEGILTPLKPMALSFKCVPIDYDRALRPEKLSELIGGRAEAYDSVKAGVSEALKDSEKDGAAVCALGSLYLSESVRVAFGEIMNGGEK